MNIPSLYKGVFLLITIHLSISGSAQEMTSKSLKDSTVINDVDSTIAYSLMLDSIEVSPSKSAFRLKGSTLFVNVEYDEILSHQNDMAELLGKIPGVIKNGNSITVAGKSPVYYIDNRKVMDAEEIDLLSVEQIRNIKVITTANARYDSEGRPVIDIKTKRMGEGLAYNIMGDLRQGKYFSQKYRLNLSYNYKKWDFFLAYNYQYGKEWIGGDSQTGIMADTLWNQNSYIDNLDRIGAHHYKLGTSYHLSPNSLIGIQYSGSFNSNKKNDTDSTFLVPDKGIPSFLNTWTHGTGKTNVHHINVYYKTGLGKNWELNTYGDYVRKDSHSDRFLNERDNILKDNHINYTQKSAWDVLAAHLQLSHESEKYGTFAFGYDFSYSHGTDCIDYVDRGDNGKTDNKESKNALFFNYTKDIGNFSIDAGLRYEYVHSLLKENYLNEEMKDHYHRILPSLTLSHSWRMLMHSLSYSIGTERPNFTDMNNNRAYTNRYNRGEGNLNLRTETDHELSYMLMYKFLYLNISYEYLHHPLMQRYFNLPGNSAVIVNRTENFSDRQSLTCLLNLRHTIKCWTPSVTFSMMKSYADYPGPNGTTLKDGRPVVTAIIDNAFSLPHNWLLSSRFEYCWGGYLQMIKIDPFSTLDFSIQKSFAKDRWRLSLNAYDIFKKGDYNGFWQHDNIQINHHTLRDSRKIGITLTYRFRKNKEINKQNAAEKEMSRLKIEEKDE